MSCDPMAQAVADTFAKNGTWGTYFHYAFSLGSKIPGGEELAFGGKVSDEIEKHKPENPCNDPPPEHTSNGWAPRAQPVASA